MSPVSCSSKTRPIKNKTDRYERGKSVCLSIESMTFVGSPLLTHARFSQQWKDWAVVGVRYQSGGDRGLYKRSPHWKHTHWFAYTGSSRLLVSLSTDATRGRFKPFRWLVDALSSDITGTCIRLSLKVDKITDKLADFGNMAAVAAAQKNREMFAIKKSYSVEVSYLLKLSQLHKYSNYT